MGDEETTVFPTNFLLKALTVAFGGWAAIVAWAAQGVISKMDEIEIMQSQQFREEMVWRQQVERRITFIETWAKEHQIFMERELKRQEEHEARENRQRDR